MNPRLLFGLLFVWCLFMTAFEITMLAQGQEGVGLFIHIVALIVQVTIGGWAGYKFLLEK